MNTSTVCLIDLSQEDSQSTNQMTTSVFPPVSNDELFVKAPFGRKSMDNNPFDMAEQQAKMFDDPFEIKQLPRNLFSNLVVPTGPLIEVANDLSGFSSIGEVDDFSGSSLNDLNKAMITMTSIELNASSPEVRSSEIRHRFHSEPDASGVEKIKRRMELAKTRTTSLDQHFRKTQFLKKLANSPLSSTDLLKLSTDELKLENSSCFEGISLIQKLANSSTQSVGDDLMSTKPEWIDSENEDSDIESLTIPFLKNLHDKESTTETNEESTTDRDDIIEKLSKYKHVAEASATEEEREEKKATADERSTTIHEICPQSKVDFMSMIGTLRDVVSKCGDEKSKGEASLVLDNLNVYLSNYVENTHVPSTNHFEPTPVIRQRTFSIDQQAPERSQNDKPSEIAVGSSSVETLPVAISTSSRKSFSSSIPSTPLSSRRSSSFSYAEKSMAAVSAVANKNNELSTTGSSSSRLMRRSTISTPPRPAHPAKHQSSPRKEPQSPLPRSISRKTIMKPTLPLSRQSSVPVKPLKLRIGEKTKAGGPMKAVVPLERVSSSKRSVLSLNLSVTNSDASAEAKKPPTSTPILSTHSISSRLPGARSTPRIGKRLSYVPTTPKANLNPRQVSSERKKTVTFSSELDKMSTSMIDGGSATSNRLTVPVFPNHRRRSVGTNKENAGKK